MDKIYSIYKIINTENNKVYIGQTCRTLKDRFRDHKYNTSTCRKLRDAMQELGKDKFSIDFIASTSDVKTADKLEEFWSDAYDSVENGYNVRRPGNNCHSPETCAKISETMTGKKSPNTSGDNHWTRQPENAETVAKVITAMTENGAWNKGLTGEGAPMFGKQHSEETKQKMSQTAIEGNAGERLERAGKQTRFKKGTIPWNKGKKGVMPTPWNKGIKQK